MQEKLTLSEGDALHMFTLSGGHVNVVVVQVDGDDAVCLVQSQDQGTGLSVLYWDLNNALYRTRPSGYEVRVERPVYVGARLMKTQTDDGITTIAAPIGKRYKLDLMSIEARKWGNVNRPGEFRTRKSGVFTAIEDGDPGVIPLELFEIKAN